MKCLLSTITSIIFLSVSVQVFDDTNIIENIHCMAFCFKLMDKEYYPVVTGNKIGFEVTSFLCSSKCVFRANRVMAFKLCNDNI